jgi:hypothetical protein
MEAQLKQLQETLLTANGYNYEQDIKPWLGKTVMMPIYLLIRRQARQYQQQHHLPTNLI